MSIHTRKAMETPPSLPLRRSPHAYITKVSEIGRSASLLLRTIFGKALELNEEGQIMTQRLCASFPRGRGVMINGMTN